VSVDRAPSILDGTLAVTPRVFALVAGIVTERNERPAYADRSFFLDDEDALGEGEQRRHAMRGGFWNARDMGRVLDGFTIADAAALRRALRDIGFPVTKDEADSLLAQAGRGTLRTMSRAKAKAPAAAAKRKRAPMSPAERKAAQRAEARDKGFCTMNPAHGETALNAKGEHYATCADCQAASNAALARRRKTASAAAKNAARSSKKRGRKTSAR
jgi:hypothetical protein